MSTLLCGMKKSSYWQDVVVLPLVQSAMLLLTAVFITALIKQLCIIKITLISDTQIIWKTCSLHVFNYADDMRRHSEDNNLINC